MVIIKPITPREFFTIFICNGLNLLEDKSKSITADDQQTAVNRAYKSPIIKYNFEQIIKKPLSKGAFFRKEQKFKQAIHLLLLDLFHLLQL